MTATEGGGAARAEPTAVEPDEAAERERVAVAETRVRRDAPAIYGSLLVTAVIAVQWNAYTSNESIAFAVVISVVVFWLTHVWAELVDRRVTGPITRGDVARIAAGEAPMLSAAVPPAMILMLADLGVMTDDRALAIALLVSVVQLFLWGFAVGRALGRGWGVALLVAAVDCAFGLVLVVLKVGVVH